MLEEEEELSEDIEGAGEDLDSFSAGEENDDPPWGATMVVNDITFAVSLFWQPLQDVDDPIPEVKETAEGVMDGADLYCLRQGNAPQYGIGNSQEGHRPGQPSAAAVLAEKYADRPSSVAVFEVDEGWWFIAVRNDLILSEEDILYLEEEDAKRAFYAMMAVPDWGRKIAPASWDIDGTEEVDLWDVLTDVGKSPLKRIAAGKDQKTMMIAGGAGLLLLLIGYKLISGMFTTAPKVIRPITPLRPVFEEEIVQTVVEVKPWEKLNDYEDFLGRCYTAVQQVRSIVVPGWTSGDITCTPSGASSLWSMKWGHVGWLKRAFEEYGMKDVDYSVAEQANSALVTVSIGNVGTRVSLPKFMAHEAREELYNIFQALKMHITITDKRDRAEVVTSKQGLVEKVHGREGAWPRLEFKFTSEYAPRHWYSLFEKFPALEIMNLTYNIGSNTWNYEGQIYEPSRF